MAMLSRRTDERTDAPTIELRNVCFTYGGEPILKGDGVGLMPNGTALASSVVGMDHCVRTFHRLTGVPLETVVRMASLTPARIAGHDREIGSLTPGKRADLVVLDAELNVRRVYRDGELQYESRR